MKKLALAALVLGSIACSKTDQTASSATKEPAAPAPATTAVPAPAPAAAAPAPKVVQGSVAAAEDPANLPPAGTPPAPVNVDNLDSLWSTPIKTLQGKPTTLAAYKGKALMVVNVASKCGNTPQYATLE